MKRWLVLGLLLISIAAVGTFVLAQEGRLAVPWFQIGGGLFTSSDGDKLTLSGSVGQPGTGAAGGGEFALSGGFLSGISILNSDKEIRLYLPVIVKR